LVLPSQKQKTEEESTTEDTEVAEMKKTKKKREGTGQE
jgi:hypothetical protein